MSIVTKAPQQVWDLLGKILPNHERLKEASVGVCVTDAKPFKAGKVNLGKAMKFSDFAKTWQSPKYDFCLVLCADLYYQILNDSEREALLDLLLTCCDVEYEPLTQTVNGKEVKVVDDWGRTQYSDQIKIDDEGNPKWKLNSLDLVVFVKNATRYNLWLKRVMDGLDSLQVNKV